jgi:bifunctional damage-control phosphatase, subfamily II, fusion protein
LAKIVYVSSDREPGREHAKLVFAVSETKDLETLLNRLANIITSLGGKPVEIIGTGGGIFKYNDRITGRLGMQLQCEDEMECLITGESHCFQALHF